MHAHAAPGALAFIAPVTHGDLRLPSATSAPGVASGAPAKSEAQKIDAARSRAAPTAHEDSARAETSGTNRRAAPVWRVPASVSDLRAVARQPYSKGRCDES